MRVQGFLHNVKDTIWTSQIIFFIVPIFPGCAYMWTITCIYYDRNMVHSDSGMSVIVHSGPGMPVIVNLTIGSINTNQWIIINKYFRLKTAGVVLGSKCEKFDRTNIKSTPRPRVGLYLPPLTYLCPPAAPLTL